MNEIKYFHLLKFFKDGIRVLDISDLREGLNIILSDEFCEKINKAFDDSLKYLDDYNKASLATKRSKNSNKENNRRKKRFHFKCCARIVKTS